MRRHLLTAAVTTALGLGLVLPTAATAAPTTAAPTTGVSASRANAADDTATVCASTKQSVTDTLNQFVADMQTVSTQAQAGDLTSAEQTVRTAGAKLTALGAQLRSEAQNADDATLKTSVTNMGTEFTTLGTNLNSLTSLQTFNTTKLDAAAADWTRICNITPGPGLLSPTAPQPSAS